MFLIQLLQKAFRATTIDPDLWASVDVLEVSFTKYENSPFVYLDVTVSRPSITTLKLGA